ncbi:MAG: hypothetical protein AMXMBFR47_33500 [Planctomycetota bacterium]
MNAWISGRVVAGIPHAAGHIPAAAFLALMQMVRPSLAFWAIEEVGIEFAEAFAVH